MALVTSKELMQDAEAKCYAVGAFNAVNMESMQAVFNAAEETLSPFILQITQTTVGKPGEITYSHLDELVAMAFAIAQRSTVPMALHLDHGRSFDICAQFICEGFTSVMIDGSLDETGKNPRTYEENVAVTRKVVELAHSAGIGISVEAEIGNLGQIEEGGSEDILTKPEEAKKLVDDTGVDLLAVAIGTKHGLFKGKPRIYSDRVKAIKDAANIPLVMHGGTGVPEEDVVAGIKNGIRKINIDTEIRLAFTECLKEKIHELEGQHADADGKGDPRKYDIRKLLGPARTAAQEAIAKKMELFGSAGNA